MKSPQEGVKAELTLDPGSRGQLVRGTLPKRLRKGDQKEKENQVSTGVLGTS